MKLLRNYGITLVVALTIVMTSCGGGPIEHGTKYVVECSTEADTADMTATFKVLESRLNNFGLEGDYEIARDNNRITIKVRTGAIADESKMRKLLQSTANLTFRATYSAGEIGGTINEAHLAYLRINHIDSTNPNGEGLSGLVAAGSDNYEGPVIFYCFGKDTAAVMNIFRTDSIAVLFPSDLVFHWGTGINAENGLPTYALYAGRVGSNYVMSGNNIESATARESEYSASYEIDLVFNKEGSRDFARITKANVGRNLAIELDDFVYSAPTVNSEITGGQGVVSGNFSKEEAEDLAKILSAGYLPTPVRIVEESEF